jgi:hypothetical protein
MFLGRDFFWRPDLRLGSETTPMCRSHEEVARNGEVIGRITKCQGLSEIVSIQVGWVQDAADDYLKEMTKLMEVSGRIMGSLLGSVGQAETRSPPTNVPMRAAS